METAKVFWTDLDVHGESILEKFSCLLDAAGLGELPLQGALTAVKLHFGEPGNLAYLRPNYARLLTEKLRSLGAKPFLTDCNTLYEGKRRNAVDHLQSAYENGYSPFSGGGFVIIGDGLKGTDDVAVPVEGGVYVQKAKIGRVIMDADVFISMTHFKGHEITGIGGALKNIGMGCGSEAGKKEMHAVGKPIVLQDTCIGCGKCQQSCAYGAAKVTDGKAFVDVDKCAGCHRCVGVCPTGAMRPGADNANDACACRITEYTKAVVDGRPQLHIAFVQDVSPYCDCYGYNQPPIVPDVGIFVSSDPVALDLACAEAVLRQPVLQDSLLGGKELDGKDYFTALHPDSDWRAGIAHGVKIGLGTDRYTLVEVE